MAKAILLEKSEGRFKAHLADLAESDFTGGDVAVEVAYSTINYKDALAITDRAPVVRRFPMVPGIDLAGIVRESAHSAWQAGDPVLVNGFGLGETRWGGLARFARVDGQCLMRLPAQLSARRAMGIGTAGYTAMLCIMALERQGITPQSGDVLVTGASGGVGTYAIALLAARGYRVVASTGRTSEAQRLHRLGAAEIMERTELSPPGKPLGRERWAGAVDTVGSHTLANVCSGMRHRGVVSACGMVQGLDFPGSVAPFILRGITLAGIDSARAPLPEREIAWRCLAEELDPDLIDQQIEEIPLHQAITRSQDLLDGKVHGRVVVNVNA